MVFTVFSLLSFPPGNRLKAFFLFVRLRSLLPKAEGALFAKVMGCGHGAVFSVKPDWGRYAFLVEWGSEETSNNFYQSKVWRELEALTTEQYHVSLLPIHAKGVWDGKRPFQPNENATPTTKMAVLTRADLKPLKLRSFFEHARRTTDAVMQHEGLQFSLGMGEVPFLRQATFSIWESETVMKAYAYKNATHIEAMHGKNKQGWYGEEMYVRFAVLKEAPSNVNLLLTDS